MWSVVVVVSSKMLPTSAYSPFWVAFHIPSHSGIAAVRFLFSPLRFHELLLLLLCHSSSTLVLQLYLRYEDW